MIDIPIGKALVAVERKRESCRGCALLNRCGGHVICRRDGKNVIFKLVDWPAKEHDDLTTMSEIYNRGIQMGFKKEASHETAV